MPKAFITGITGQDGQHLAEFLHSKGYQVYGMLKGQNNPRANPWPPPAAGVSWVNSSQRFTSIGPWNHMA